MPRGRGRRGTSSQSQPIPPRSASRGRRRQASITASRSPDVPLRRSERLLRQSIMIDQPASTAVAMEPSSQSRPSEEQTELSSISAEAEQHRQRLRQRDRRQRELEDITSEDEPTMPLINGDPPAAVAGSSLLASNRDDERSESPRTRYEMEIVVQPPASVRQGIRLYPPITIRLQIRDSRTGEEMTAREDLSQIWAMASVIEEDGQEQSSSPGNHILTGNLVDSAHPLDDDESPQAERESAVTTNPELGLENIVGSYLTFPSLVLNKTGNFRIRISLMRMEGGGALVTSVPEGALALQEVQSRVIRVGDGLDGGELGDNERAFLESLQRRGLPVPSPPSSPPVSPRRTSLQRTSPAPQ